MNTFSPSDVNQVLRDLRYHEFKAGVSGFLKEGKAAALEVIASRRTETTCDLEVIITPFGPPRDVNPEALAGASEAVQSSRPSPHPRVRAAADRAAEVLAGPSIGDLTNVDVDLWWEDAEGWDSRQKQRLAQESPGLRASANFPNVPLNAECFIELLDTKSTEMCALVPLVRVLPARIPELTGHLAPPPPGHLETVKEFTNQEGLDIELLRGRREGDAKRDPDRLWITISTRKKEWNHATVQFRIGPLRGAVQLVPAGDHWRGTEEVKLRRSAPIKTVLERMDKWERSFSVVPLQH